MKEDPVSARYRPKQASWSYQSNGIFNDLISGRDYPERRAPVKEALTRRSSKRGSATRFRLRLDGQEERRTSESRRPGKNATGIEDSIECIEISRSAAAPRRLRPGLWGSRTDLPLSGIAPHGMAFCEIQVLRTRISPQACANRASGEWRQFCN